MKNYRTNKISHWEQQFYTVQWTGDPTPSSLNILPNKTIKQLIVELGKLTTLSDYKHFNVKIQHLNPTTESFYLYKCTADLTDFTGFSSFSTLQKKIHVQFLPNCSTTENQQIFNRTSTVHQHTKSSAINKFSHRIILIWLKKQQQQFECFTKNRMLCEDAHCC